MFKVLILVCSVQISPQDCQTDNAVDVIQGPDASNEITCAFTGQAYIAETALGTGLGRDHYVKVTCIRQADVETETAVAPPAETNCASPASLHRMRVALAGSAPVPSPLAHDAAATPGASALRAVTLGTFQSADALRRALRDDGCKVGGKAEEAMARPAFVVSKIRAELDLAVLSVAQLGFGAEGASIAELYARAAQLGFKLCPAEIGPQLRLQYLNQPAGEFLRIAMEPIETAGGDHVAFIVGNGGAGLALLAADAGPDVVVPPTLRYVFLRPR